MVHDIVTSFYKRKIKLDIDSNISTISDTIKKELENIEELEVWKLHKDKLEKRFTIDTFKDYDYKTGISKKIYYITSMLYYTGIPYYEKYDNDDEKVKIINEKFPKELLKYVISEEII